MGDLTSWQSRAPARRASGPVSGVAGVLGVVASVAALAVAAVVAVAFAATLAVVMALATLLLGLTALVWRIRRPAPRAALIEARRVGHSWIAYGWDRRSS